MRSIPIKPSATSSSQQHTYHLMSMRNVASPDGDIGTRAVFLAPDNWGLVTRYDNRRHTSSRIDGAGAYPEPLEVS